MHRFPGGFRHKIGPLSSNRFLVSRARVTSGKLVCAYVTIFNISLKINVYDLKYCWYTEAQYYRAHTDHIDFLNRITVIGQYIGQTRSVSQLPILNHNVPKIQLDCPSAAQWDVVITFAAEVRF